jgi:hypothetical protein
LTDVQQDLETLLHVALNSENSESLRKLAQAVTELLEGDDITDEHRQLWADTVIKPHLTPDEIELGTILERLIVAG